MIRYGCYRQTLPFRRLVQSRRQAVRLLVFSRMEKVSLIHPIMMIKVGVQWLMRGSFGRYAFLHQCQIVVDKSYQSTLSTRMAREAAVSSSPSPKSRRLTTSRPWLFKAAKNQKRNKIISVEQAY